MSIKAGKKWDSKQSSELFMAIASLKSVAEVKRFMRDLCTSEELIDMSDRWQTAKQLAKGLDYRTIADNLKISTTTVARVAYWLNSGLGGYREMLKRFNIKFHHTSLLSGER